MRIAVEGCAHGELEVIYGTLLKIMEDDHQPIDLLICCGDFQCARNEQDMQCMSIPPKYLAIGSFYKYYSGEKQAPIPTLFIHGNHEAVNYLKELYFGGWVAPNIYYMGYSGVIRFGGIRIAGLSGIFNEGDFRKGHYERPPYANRAQKSAYHVREYELFKLLQLSPEIDIMLSHDWPRRIYHHGDTGSLLAKKPYFRQEIQNNQLGSEPCERLLSHLQPKHWFSAHLHVKFAALVLHPSGMKTRFLALDKCLPRRDFLHILDLPSPSTTRPYSFEYDPEWLAILHHTHPLYNTSYHDVKLPETSSINQDSLQTSKEHITKVSATCQSLGIPHNFQITIPAYKKSLQIRKRTKLDRPNRMAGPFENPQTEAFAARFGIRLESHTSRQHSIPSVAFDSENINESEITYYVKNPIPVVDQVTNPDLRVEEWFKMAATNPDQIELEL